MRTVLMAVLVLVAVLLGAAFSSRSNADAEPDRKGKEQLETAAKKTLPERFNKWFTRAVAEKDKPVDLFKTELKLLRWYGPSEAKLTYACTFNLVEDWKDSFTLTFTLRYYEGKWLTTSVYTSNPKPELGTDLMLVADIALAE